MLQAILNPLGFLRTKNLPRSLRIALSVVGLVGLATLAACSSNKREPASLPANPNTIGAAQRWSVQLPAQEEHFKLQQLRVGTQELLVAAGRREISAVDASTGATAWTVPLDFRVDAGVGAAVQGEAAFYAVVSAQGELVVLRGGLNSANNSYPQIAWRSSVDGRSYTPPLVAGGRVFVQTLDRTVQAFDLQTGQRLWLQKRPATALVLSHAALLHPAGNSLVVGSSGRVFGLNPTDGAVQWDVTLANTRSLSELDRLGDFMSDVSRSGESLCVRAYTSRVGCINALRGTFSWAQNSPQNTQSVSGVGGDAQLVVGVEDNNRVQAWQRDSGVPAWNSEGRLLNRGLGTPVVLGRSVAVGDSQGFVHLLDRQDGRYLGRIDHGGKGVHTIRGGAQSVLVLSRDGRLASYEPQ